MTDATDLDTGHPHTFQASAFQDGDFWMIEFSGEGREEWLTQAESKAGITAAAREYIALQVDRPIDEIAVSVEVFE